MRDWEGSLSYFCILFLTILVPAVGFVGVEDILSGTSQIYPGTINLANELTYTFPGLGVLGTPSKYNNILI